MTSEMRLEVLHVRDCPNLMPMLERLAEVTDLPVATHEIDTTEEAVARGMAGSPTLLVNGVDPFADAEACECGVSCRLYRDEEGRMMPVPSAAQLHSAIRGDGATPGPEPVEAGEILSAWRTRAVPLNRDEAVVHRAILRGFADTGTPPTSADLDRVTAPYGRPTTEVLRVLHEIDAIRLSGDGQIAVAYPFSTAPTRHRVRLDDRIDVYAMCAIDALGMSPMLGADTRIRSTDLTDGAPITVTTIDGRTSWTPSRAVAVIGSELGGGPSAECCCDYLNLFTDAESAHAWLAAHPEVPGQVLAQTQAEALGARLFGHLLVEPA
jgi:hypothetical protein